MFISSNLAANEYADVADWKISLFFRKIFFRKKKTKETQTGHLMLLQVFKSIQMSSVCYVFC